MFTIAEKTKIKELYNEVWNKIQNEHVRCFKGMDKPLFLISTTYPGVWMEHIYDSVMYAWLCDEGKQIARNTIEAFISFQKEDGQLPFGIFDGSVSASGETSVAYSQIQEVVSFSKLAYMTYTFFPEKDYLEKIYKACVGWNNWLKNNRMTLGKGLIEMFVGFDTGHDNSARLEGMTCHGNNTINGVRQNASVLPENDPVVPILAVDMNCNYYAGKRALEKMAKQLGDYTAAQKWAEEAAEVKAKMMELLYDEEDMFFYDVDKNGNKRKCKSCTVFHLFMEGVLWPEEKLAIDIYEKHVKNPEEFWTEYPFPSMAVNDPAWKKTSPNNCWGYFSQALIALRTTMWMERYGRQADMLHIMEKWVKAWTECYDEIKFGQELDPITGKPSDCSQWYSSCMLYYVYSVRKLGLLD